MAAFRGSGVSGGRRVKLLLLLLTWVLCVESAAKGKSALLRRTKRTWIIPPAKIKENEDFTTRKFIAKIRSDKDKEAKVAYYLTGEGADKPPYNLFVVDPNTGFVRITGIVDREEHSKYHLSGVARFSDGTIAEPDIPLVVTIVDENDNPPYIEFHSGSITERSKKGTFVMQIDGKDNDEEGTINSQISYRIVSQEPEGTHMFSIDETTGKLYVKEDTLDREHVDFYRLVVMGTDLGGRPGGLTGSGTVEIHVLDINDNLPTLEQSEYNGAVDENVHDVVVMRIKAVDMDLEHTDNWLAVFKIAKGNEDNLFSIETDPDTNEGVLKLIKPVDFEEVQNLELGLMIENVAPYVDGGGVEMDVGVQVGEGHRPNLPGGVGVGAGAGVSGEVHGGVDAGMGGGLDASLETGLDGGLNGGLSGELSGELGGGLDGNPHPSVHIHGSAETSEPKSFLIKIAVNNVPEGPAFIPEVKEVPVSEDPKEQPEDGIITVFAATDPDTGEPAEDVTYAKAFDPDNWFVIDEETAEIKLNKQPDRESPFLVNGTYYAKILAITKDIPAKTATGTIAIRVTDSNDHCPTLTSSHTSLCSNKKTVYVTAVDHDHGLNGAPFTFMVVPDETQGKWDVEAVNGTTAAFHSSGDLWPGVYMLQVAVADAQGHSCPDDQPFTVSVCTCAEDAEDCSSRTGRQAAPSSELSAAAIGLLLLGLCLLLLVPLLLLFCQCGGADSVFPEHFSELPFDAKEHLISYHTEGRGEDREVPLHSVPVLLANHNKVEMGQALSFNATAQFIETQQSSSYYNESVQQFHQETEETEETEEFLEVDRAYATSREMFNRGNTLSKQPLSIPSSDIFEGFGVSDHFLCDYYTQKSACVEPVNDVLLGYSFEGQGSPPGSVGCCSILESEDDLQFLNNLGPKFKTLAEICAPSMPSALVQHEVVENRSLAPPAPAASMTSKVATVVSTAANLVEPVLKPKREQSVVTKHTDVKMETINVSKTSVSAAPQPAVTPHSQITAVNHSANIVQTATLPRPAQTLVVQQSPVYYTTSAVLQPMQYVVQPQIQSTVLLADGTNADNLHGLYVIGGPQNPQSSGIVMTAPQGAPSGLVVPSTQAPPPGVLISATQGPLSGLVVPSTQGLPSGLVLQGTESPQSPASPTSPVSPTVLVPVGQVVPQGSVSVEGWKMVGPHPAGNFTLVKDRLNPAATQLVAPGSSQDILPRGAILVKGAAPPQGALSPAAQGSVFGPLPRHTLAKGVGVVRVDGSGWEGNSKGDGLERVVIGPLQVGLGHMVTANPEGSPAGVLPLMLSPPGKAEVSMSKFQPIPQLKEINNGHVRKTKKKIRSPNKATIENVKQTTPMARITNETQPSLIKTFQGESRLVCNTQSVKADEKQDSFSFITEQHMTSNHQEPGVFSRRECEDKVRIQEPEPLTEEGDKTSNESAQLDTLKSFPKHVFEMSSEQYVPDQLIPNSKASSEGFADEFSQDKESSGLKGNSDKVGVLFDGRGTDVPGPGLGLTESGDGSIETEDALTSVTKDHENSVAEQVYSSLDLNIEKCEERLLEKKACEEDKLIHIVASECFDNRQISDELVEQAGSGEMVSLCLADEGTAGLDLIQAEENVEEQPASSTDTHNVAEEQRSDSEVKVKTVIGEAKAALCSETSHTTKSDVESVFSPETTLELPGSEDSEEIPAERETIDRPKLEDEDCPKEDHVLATDKVTVTSTNVQAEEGVENRASSDSTDEELEKQWDVDRETSQTSVGISNEAEEIVTTALEIIVEPQVNTNEEGKLDNTVNSEAAVPEHFNVTKKQGDLNSKEIPEDDRQEPDQAIVFMGAEVDLDQVESDPGDVSDGEEEVMVGEEVSQLNFKSDGDTKPKLSPQPEGSLIQDQNSNLKAEGQAAVKALVSSGGQDLVLLEEKHSEAEDKPNVTSILSNQENVRILSPLKVNLIAADVQVDEVEKEFGKTPSPLMKDQLLLEGTTADGVEEGELEKNEYEEEEEEERDDETKEVIYDSISSGDEATQQEDESDQYSVDNVGDQIRDTGVSEEGEFGPIGPQITATSDKASADHDRPDVDPEEDNQLNPEDDVCDIEENLPSVQCTTNTLEKDETDIDRGTTCSKEQLLSSEDNVNNVDGEDVCTQEDQSEVDEEDDAGERTSLSLVDQIDSDFVKDQDERDLSTSPLQQSVSIPDKENDGHEKEEKEDGEEEEEEVSTEANLLLEKDPSSVEMAASKVTKEKPCEEVASGGEIIFDSGDQESKVATGQVLSPQADRGATSCISKHGDVIQTRSENTDTLGTRLKEKESLILAKSEAEGLYKFREGVLYTPAEAVGSLEAVGDNILSPVLEIVHDLAEVGEGSLSPAHDAATDLVEEGSNEIGEPEGFLTRSSDVELNSPGVLEAETGEGGGGGGQESSGTQGLVKESKRTKPESRKVLQRSRSASGKCKQQ